MEDYIKRMLDERNELIERTNKAKQFLALHMRKVGTKPDISAMEYQLLSGQVKTMEAYCTFLTMRIEYACHKEGYKPTIMDD